MIKNKRGFKTIDGPTAPGKPIASEIAEKSVALNWDSPLDDGGCEITSYVVEYNRVRQTYLIT